MAPGSMPLARELWQEGIVIPPIKLYERGRLNEAALDLLLRNVRTPDERRGDLDAQAAANRAGAARLREIVERQGVRQAWRQMDELLAYAERMMRAAIATIPDGDYEFEDALDDDGISPGAVPIRVRVSVRGDSLHCDFAGTSMERPSSVNAVAAVTQSAVYYVARCLLEALPGGEAVPANSGCFAPVSIALPEGSVLNARPPRAVSAGNVETSQRVVDVVLGALAQALPEVIPAASCGSMNNVAIGSGGDGSAPAFAYYETIGGGAGAGASGPGADAVHTHMTNTMNTPAESIEMAYPMRILEYGVRRGSGGAGRWRGGDGIVRTWEFLAPATVTIVTERRLRAPWGLAGGEQGVAGRNVLRRASGQTEELPPKVEVRVEAGDRLTLETPGGGGWGAPDPLERT